MVTADGQLVVNQEPIVVELKDNEPVVITWALPPDGGLAFDPRRGIVVLGRTKNENGEQLKEVDRKYNTGFSCGAPAAAARAAGDASPKTFTCELAARNKFRIERGLYAYEINVIGPRGAIRLDPTIMPR